MLVIQIYEVVFILQFNATFGQEFKIALYFIETNAVYLSYKWTLLIGNTWFYTHRLLVFVLQKCAGLNAWLVLS